MVQQTINVANALTARSYCSSVIPTVSTRSTTNPPTTGRRPVEDIAGDAAWRGVSVAAGLSHTAVTRHQTRPKAPTPRRAAQLNHPHARSCRIECTSVMSGRGGPPAALPGVDAGQCKRRTGRGSGRCGEAAGPRSGRPGRGWRGAVRLGAGRFELRRPSSVRLASLVQHSRGATTSGRWRCARRSGLADIGKELLVRGCIHRPMGHPPGPTTRTRTRRATASPEGGQSAADEQKARRSHSLPPLTYSGLGGLPQDPGRAAESSAGPRTDEDMGAGRACVVVDVWGTR